MPSRPLAGAHFPRSLGEFRAWFATDADCVGLLGVAAVAGWVPVQWVRSRGHACAWELADGRYECCECHERTSVTAGTIFDRTRMRLTVWFMAWAVRDPEGRGLGVEPEARA